MMNFKVMVRTVALAGVNIVDTAQVCSPCTGESWRTVRKPHLANGTLHQNFGHIIDEDVNARLQKYHINCRAGYLKVEIEVNGNVIGGSAMSSNALSRQPHGSLLISTCRIECKVDVSLDEVMNKDLNKD